MTATATATAAPPAKVSWRDVLPVHPAADLFPLMTPDELKALGEDIQKNKLLESVALWTPWRHKDIAAYSTNPGPYERAPEWFLLDGRNRLDALALMGRPMDFLHDGRNNDGLWWIGDGVSVNHLYGNTDPYEYVISANIHRRHLTAEDKRKIIAKVIAAQPEKSNRSIAEIVKRDHKTVGAVRAEMEQLGSIPQLTKTIGKDGKQRKQPVKRKLPEPAPNLSPVDDVEAAGEDDLVATPEQIESNLLYGIARGNENARAYNRIAKASALDREAAERISTAIERLIQKWRSVQSTLAKKG